MIRRRLRSMEYILVHLRYQGLSVYYRASRYRSTSTKILYPGLLYLGSSDSTLASRYLYMALNNTYDCARDTRLSRRPSNIEMTDIVPATS
jgi:hypothetical protein